MLIQSKDDSETDQRITVVTPRTITILLADDDRNGPLKRTPNHF